MIEENFLRKSALSLNWLTSILALSIVIQPKQAVGEDAKYFLHSDQSTQQIPFFCEENNLVGLITAQDREEFFQKDKPFVLHPFYVDFEFAGMGQYIRNDLFGSPQYGPGYFEGNNSIKDFDNKKKFEEAKRKYYEPFKKLYPKDESTLGIKAQLPLNSEGSGSNPCRQVEQAAVTCVTSRRAVYIVNLGDNAFGYRSYDFKSSIWQNPSTLVDGGHLADFHPDSMQFKFAFEKDGYQYQLEQLSPLPKPSATLSVLKDGQIVQTEECQLFSASPDDFGLIASTNVAENHPNGGVLVGIFGGKAMAIDDSVRLYDPETNRWTKKSAFIGQARSTFLPLSNGNVLAVKGASLEIYDGRKDQWSTVASQLSTETTYSATSLRNGKVLFVVNSPLGSNAESIELFDPVSGSWTASNGYGGFGTELSDGKVLIISNDSVSYMGIYDTGKNLWDTLNTTVPWAPHLARALPDRGVLIVGYSRGSDSQQVPFGVYYPESQGWKKNVLEKLRFGREVSKEGWEEGLPGSLPFQSVDFIVPIKNDMWIFGRVAEPGGKWYQEKAVIFSTKTHHMSLCDVDMRSWQSPSAVVLPNGKVLTTGTVSIWDHNQSPPGFEVFDPSTAVCKDFTAPPLK